MSTALPVPVRARSRMGWLRRLYDVLERPLGELEPAYRQQFLRSDVDQAVFGLAMMAVPILLLGFADFLAVGLGKEFASLMLVRLLFASLTVLVVLHLRRVRAPDQYDRAVLDLLKPADRALYRAKDRGRDRVEAA